MSHPRRTTAVLIALASALALGGCAAPVDQQTPTAPPPAPSRAAPTPPPLPPRPSTLLLDGINPCDLLTSAQARQLNTDPGTPGSDENGSLCQWSNDSAKPNNAWIASLILTHGAEYFLGSVTGSTRIQVDGYTAVATTSDRTPDPEYQCLLYLDVAPGQSLEVSYDNINGDYPGINHQVACGFAAKAAHLMLTNLRTLTH